MSNLILPRRKFLFGLAGIFAAPAIVKATSLMQVTSIEEWVRPPPGPRSVWLVSWRPMNESGLSPSAEPHIAGMAGRVEQTLIYSTTDGPRMFKGFTAFYDGVL